MCMRSELLPNGIDDLTDAVEDFIHGAQTVDVGEFSLFGVKVRDDGRLFVIPRGNLMALPEKPSTGAAEVEGRNK